MSNSKSYNQTSARASENVRTALVAATAKDSEDTIIEGLQGVFEVKSAGDPTDPSFPNKVATESPTVILLSLPSTSADLLALIRNVLESYSAPLVVFTPDADAEQAKAAIRAGTSAFIVDGLSAPRILSLVEIAIERYALTNALQTELAKVQNDLAARKSIERAKGLLMERKKMSESQAYDAMRRMAMSQGKPMKVVAETILSMSELLP